MKKIFYLIILITMFSCSTQEKIFYPTNFDDAEKFTESKFSDIKINTDANYILTTDGDTTFINNKKLTFK